MKINFHKSEVFCYCEAKHYEQEYTKLFGCERRTYPFRYLGIPMQHRKLCNSDRGVIGERFKHKPRGVYNVLWEQLILLNSVLSSLPMCL